METESPTRLLIVDDDALVRKIYSELMAKYGFAVEVASDGQMAIEKLVSFQPEMVLLDIFLPKLNGVEVLKHIRNHARFSHIPVVMFSTSSTSRHIDAALRLGVTKVIAKDHFEPAQLVDLLRSTVTMTGSKKSPSSAVDADGAPDSESESQSELAGPESLEQVRLRTMETLPRLRNELRDRWQLFVNSELDNTRIPKLYEVRRIVQSAINLAQNAIFDRLFHLGTVLDNFLRELYEKPHSINASSIRTINQGVDLFAILCNADLAVLTAPSLVSSVLVVHEKVSALDLMAPLRVGNLTVVGINNAAIALTLLEQNRFHSVFWDMEMPGITGAEISVKIRTIPVHTRTPLVLFTSAEEIEMRDHNNLKSVDLMAMPFLFQELAVRAFVAALRDQLSAQPR